MTRKKKKISDLVTINSGYTFRHKIENQSDGDLGIIQPKDTEPNYINEESVFKVQDEGMKDKFILQQGDVLFLGKGANNFAVCYNYVQRSVAASSFFVLKRKSDNEVLSEYLMYYLNSPVGQKILSSGKEGTYVSNISKKTLEDLEVVLPDLEEQKKLCHLYQLGDKEIRLTKELLEKKQLLSRAIQTNTITGKQKI